MASVKFVPKGDATRVEVAVPNHDRTVVVTEKGYESADVGVINALDQQPLLQRASHTSAKDAHADVLPAPPRDAVEQPPAALATREPEPPTATAAAASEGGS